MSQAAGCFSGLVSRISRSRGAVSAPTSDRCARHDDTLPNGVANPLAFNTVAALDATRYACVGTNAERIGLLHERYFDVLHFGHPMPDAVFIEQVTRPLVTWLKALSYLPDEGQFSDIGVCARELLSHVVVPESRSRHTLQRFGSTEALDRDDAPMEIARAFVTWTVPLLHRLVALLKCVATGQPSVDTFQKLLLSIRRQAIPDDPDAAPAPETVFRALPAAPSSESESTPDALDEPIYATVLPRSERLRRTARSKPVALVVDAEISPIRDDRDTNASPVLESTRL